MSRRILAESDRDRLRAILHGKSLAEVRALLPDVSADTAARAACGMPVTSASRLVILQCIATLHSERSGGA